MSYCPECRYEYPPELETCPECGEPLVAKISESFAPAVSPDDSWVLVGGVASETKAKVARGSLDSNNIPSVFMPAKLEAPDRKREISLDPALRGTGTDLILVPREFGDEARLLLQAVLGDELIEPVVDNPLI
ncbi:MAG: hypothetical protein JSU74_04455 [Candidatus Zixiibacteriota bacterium]|nr:MAG: hypothetical protein JSU74_04455 [candidate division Zixibacteria bacterium]